MCTPSRSLRLHAAANFRQTHEHIRAVTHAPDNKRHCNHVCPVALQHTYDAHQRSRRVARALHCHTFASLTHSHAQADTPHTTAAVTPQHRLDRLALLAPWARCEALWHQARRAYLPTRRTHFWRGVAQLPPLICLLRLRKAMIGSPLRCAAAVECCPPAAHGSHLGREGRLDHRANLHIRQRLSNATCHEWGQGCAPSV